MNVSAGAAVALGLLLAQAPERPEQVEPADEFDDAARLDEEEIAAELVTLRRNASDPDRALGATLALARILETFDAARSAVGLLTAVQTELYLRALDYRARAYVTRGETALATADLREAVLTDPRWTPDLAGLDPRVLDLFEEQRDALVGYLSVSTTPEGAFVLSGERRIGTTPLVAHPIFAGPVRIRLEKPGYAPGDEGRFEILPREVLAIERELERVGPVLPIVTAPPGVTVRLGGRVMGTTSGSLPDDLRPLAPPLFADSEFSAPLVIGVDSVGDHEVRLEAACYRPARFRFRADEPRDYLPRFVRLRPSTGGMRVEAPPGGGVVFVDGEERGPAPLTFSSICSGVHDVEVRGPAGRCRRSVDVARGARVVVECDPAPAVSLAPSAPRSDPAVDAAVRAALASGTDFVSVEDAAETPGGPGLEDWVQGYLRIVIPDGTDAGARVELYTPGSQRPDVEPFDRFLPETAGDAVRRLLAPVVRRRAWLGVTAGIARRPTPESNESVLQVLDVHPDGPAVLAGIEVGDRIVRIDGEPVATELGLAERVGVRAPDETLEMELERDGAPRAVRVVLASTPVLPDPGEGRCNRRLLALGVEAATGGGLDPIGRLESAACRIMLDDPGTALRLDLAGLELGGGRGIGAGAAHYYRGMAFEAAGEPERAARSYRLAAEAPGATLVDHDGPRIAPLARRRLARLR